MVVFENGPMRVLSRNMAAGSGESPGKSLPNI
jgi:hypothetical protein